MATEVTQESWLPFDGGSIHKDCSEGFCTVDCPQWCYALFSPPPPPSSLAGADDNYGVTFSPLVICIIAVLASALLLLSYYTFVSKNCASLLFSRRPFQNEEHAGGGASNSSAAVLHEEWIVLPSNGLEEALINKIATLRYRKKEAVVDRSDCSVCLGEFKEGERLRLLPKCSHAFHLQCIDTWLRSHANCPLCRANIVLESDEHEKDVVLIIEDAGNGEEEEENEEEDECTEAVETGEEDTEPIRRCLSMGSWEAYVGRELMEAKLCGFVGEGENWRKRDGEYSSGNGRNRELNCVRSTVRMKRSVSSGMFFFGRRGRGRVSFLSV